LNPDRVFVYGGLMRGFDLHHHMTPSEFVGRGMVDGALLALGAYPGLVEGDATVRGEVYRFEDMPAALDVLDDIEQYNPADPDGSLYVRLVQPVRMDDGRVLDAWVYRYHRPAGDAPRVPNGDWHAAQPNA